MERRIGNRDSMPEQKFHRGDLVTVRGRGDMVVFCSYGRTRTGLGPWMNEYYVCPLRKDGKGPDLRTWNAAFRYSLRTVRVGEDELTLVKEKWYD